MDEVEGITREHVGSFLGIGCHGKDERGAMEKMKELGERESFR